MIRNCQWKTLLKKDKAVTDNSEIAKALSGFFANVSKSMDIPESENIYQFYKRVQAPFESDCKV